MSEIYSSTSGSYSSYLAQRQTDEIKQQVQKSANQQSLTTAMTGYYLGSKIDSVNDNIVRMSTGIQNSINTNTYAIAASATMLKNTFDAGFDSINNKLDMGFAGVSNAIGSMSASMTAGFDSVASAIEYWGESICEKLDAIHDIVNNPLLTESRELYRRASKNSRKKFFEEALEDIKAAVEKNKTDYISWGLMGKIYLFGMSEFSNVVDVSKGLEAFTNACKYITPDIDESDEARKMASEFYFYLGFANYILANENKIEGKTTECNSCYEACIKASSKSYALSNGMLEAIYHKARAHSLLGQKNDALQCIEKIVEADPLYSIKVLSDDDFKEIESDIVSIIIQLRDNYYPKLKKEVEDIYENYHFCDSKFAQNTKRILEEALGLDSNIQYVDLRNKIADVQNIHINLNNGKIPYDVVAASVIIGRDRFDRAFSFKIEKDWNNLFIYDSFNNALNYDDYWHNSNRFGGYEIYELCKNRREPDNLMYLSFNPEFYGKGKIVLKNSLSNKTHASRGLEEDGATIFDIDENTIFKCECDTSDQYKRRVSVMQKGIVKKSVAEEMETIGNKIKKREEDHENEKRLIKENNARNDAYQRKNKKICVVLALLFIPVLLIGGLIPIEGAKFMTACLELSLFCIFSYNSKYGKAPKLGYNFIQRCLSGWAQIDPWDNIPFLFFFALFFCSLGRNLGRVVGHGFIGFLSGFGVFLVIIITLNFLSRDYSEDSK